MVEHKKGCVSITSRGYRNLWAFQQQLLICDGAYYGRTV